MKAKNIFKQKPSVYIYAILMGLCAAMFVYGLVRICKFSVGNANGNFENILQMIFSAACILILSVYFSLVKFAKLQILEPLNIYLSLFIFVFIGVYPCFNLFENVAAFGVFFAFLGFTLAIVAISIFFHFSRTQNGSLRANPWFMATFQIGFSILISVVVEILIYLFSKGSGLGTLETINDFISQVGYSLIGSVVATAISIVSLYKSKFFVNQCLIKQISD